VSQLGVDLLRSDTGHYMQWPLVDEAPTAPVPLPSQRGAERGRSWISMLGAPTVRPVAVPAAPTAAGATDRVGVYLSLVNWLVLLLMFCTFLLAKTLPADASLTSGSASSGCTVAAAACAEGSAR
jgi:hypothetical protein